MARISRIDSYQVKSGESYFFDNNVWMFLFSPIASSNIQSQAKYSNLFRDIQSRGGMIFISSLILSEYINRNLRMSFNIWKERTGRKEADYKRDYRSTQEYRDELKAVKFQVKEIMKVAVPRPDDFNALNMDVLLRNMENSDFNDEYYLYLCEKNDLKLVTDDADMKTTSRNIEIITK